jgi:hypothetical protein
MKPTTTMKKTFMPPLNLARIGALVAVGLVGFALVPAGCIGGWDYSNVPEGDRCNPYDSHNECSSGLQCTVSSWQVANQGVLTPQGNVALFLGPGAGMNTSTPPLYNVLEYCPENYCCPVDSNGNLTGTSSNPNCQAGCNGGAAALCTALGNNTTPPYTGVCDFLDSGETPDADESDAAPATGGDGSVPEASTPAEASTPEEASTPADAGSPADGSGGG